MGGYTVRPGDTLGALAARSGVPVAQMAAMNGLDPAPHPARRHALKLPTGAPVAATAPAAATPTIVPAAAPDPAPGALSSSQIGAIAAQHGVARLAGVRHRLAGERLQQRHGLQRQRPRDHAGHARHLGLGAEQPRAAAR